ncbi:Nudix family hydrolase [Marinobacterium arenosum]|uniref:Nudix family hydrolase n=1 Tax=Marinobacterium arenosum TaxID=2862496 RepID=UPI001C97779B|nr:Nudix family hydrolase [Marinobacterium arenosum]MBY4676589.1 Nudix family hydrolase [Marinobacterium arenosum]
MAKLIHVAAAVIVDGAGRVLLAQRPQDKHQGGLWEFPGGKVEPGEPVVQALGRELDEELGIQLRSARPLIQVPHHYPDKSVLLDVYRVDTFDGEPYGREGQPVRWVPVDQLAEYPFPAANRPIVTAAQLPSRLPITGPLADPNQYPERIAAAVDHHRLEVVMLRAPELAEPELEALAQKVQLLAERQGFQLILNGSVELANAVGCAGLHLNHHRLMALTERPVFSGRWLGASCHNAQELARAVELELDYICLSPVQPTGSHPDVEPLGWQAFQQLVAELPMPVFALGGVGEQELARAWQAGAQGVAGISAWWG